MPSSDTRSARRNFLRLLALLPLAGLARRAFAQGAAPSPGGSTPPPAPATSPAPPANAAAEISPDVAPLTAILKRRYGTHVSDEELATLAPHLDHGVRIGERLRKATLLNSDEPDFVFRAIPRAAAKGKGGRHGGR